MRWCFHVQHRMLGTWQGLKNGLISGCFTKWSNKIWPQGPGRAIIACVWRIPSNRVCCLATPWTFGRACVNLPLKQRSNHCQLGGTDGTSLPAYSANWRRRSDGTVAYYLLEHHPMDLEESVRFLHWSEPWQENLGPEILAIGGIMSQRIKCFDMVAAFNGEGLLFELQKLLHMICDSGMSNHKLDERMRWPSLVMRPYWLAPLQVEGIHKLAA